MRYIQKMANSGAVQTALDEQELGKPYIAYLEDEHRIDWNGLSPDSPGPAYSAMPLTFEIISGGTINWYCNLASYGKTISFSKDNGATWTNITATSGAGAEIVVSDGDKVIFKGDNQAYGNVLNYNRGSRFFGSTATFEAYGNIMSLVDSTGFTSADTLYSANTFEYFFVSSTTLVNAENLILPATILTGSCYWGMFQGCTNLLKAPTLPATILTTNCYQRMFEGCSSLTSITCFATDIPSVYCTYDWVKDVSATGIFVKHPNMSSWPSGVNGIPTGWTVRDAVL